jgi:hypothetical protein
MAKSRLKSLTQEFIEKKMIANSQAVKTANSQEVKKQQTVYLTTSAYKLAWQNRTDTGETVSDMVNRLILKNLVTKKK